jgi:biopolymer transport protein TolR
MGMDVGGGGLKNDINVTPLVDVCLVLLIIFMVVTPMLVKGVPVALPQVRNPEIQKEDDKNILISITPDGKIFYGQKGVPLEVLRDNLNDDFTHNPNRDVYIKGDKVLEFQKVKEVLRFVQGAGFKQVGLVAQHVDEHGNIVSGNTAGAISSAGSK